MMVHLKNVGMILSSMMDQKVEREPGAELIKGLKGFSFSLNLFIIFKVFYSDFKSS